MMLNPLHSAVLWCATVGVAFGAAIGHLVAATLGATGRLDLVNGGLTGAIGGAATGVMLDAWRKNQRIDPRRILPRLRRGARTLSLLSFAAILPLGWMIHQARRQGVVVAELESLGCSAGYVRSTAPTLEERLRMLLREKRAWNVDELLVCDAPFGDAELSRLKALPHLERLDLSGSQVTDAGLAALEGMSRLHALSLARTRITDAGLAHLGALPQLNVLNIAETNVTDAGLTHLGRLTRLVVLNVSKTSIGDRALASLRQMPQLSCLFLGGTRLSDAGLAHLQGLTQLEELDLSGTLITDAGLPWLKGLNRLGYLGLVNSQVTEDGARKLRRRLPTTKIERLASPATAP